MTPEEQADYRRRIDRLIAWQNERVGWQPKPTSDKYPLPSKLKQVAGEMRKNAGPIDPGKSELEQTMVISIKLAHALADMLEDAAGEILQIWEADNGQHVTINRD